MITLKELIEYSDTMRAQGIAHLESSDLKITLGDKPLLLEETKDDKVESLKSILKMSDLELVNQLFPDNAREEMA